MFLRRGAIALIVSSLPFSVQAEIEQLSLSSAGLIETIRHVELAPTQNGPAVATLSFRSHDLDDILKSLMVSGDGLTTVSLRMESSEALADIFAGLPFSPGDLDSLDTLLSRLVGEDVEIGNSGMSGRILGVSHPAGCNSEDACRAEILLMTESGGLQHVLLRDGVEVRLVSDGQRADISRAVEALARAMNAEQARVILEVHPRPDGSLPENITVSHVTAAPLWKTSYRMVIGETGEARMQAWAILENAGTEDWNNVRLTLTSSTQTALRQDLWARQMSHRETITTNKHAPPPQSRFMMQSLDAGEAMSDSIVSMPMAELAPMATMQESQINARFTFPGNVSLAAGELMSLPFLQDGIEAERVAWFRGSSGQVNPDFALDIRNSLPVRLPAGIVSIQEDGIGYVGDAALPELSVGENRTVPYATDRGTLVEENHRGRRVDGKLRIVAGVAIIEDIEVVDYSYRATAPATQSRSLLIDHKDQPGWETRVLTDEIDAEDHLEGNTRVLRLRVELAADEEREIRLRAERPLQTQVQLVNMSILDVISWSSRGMTDEDRELLTDLMEKRTDIEEAETDIERLTHQRENLIEEQSRYVAIFQTGDDELIRQYRSRITDIDDRIEATDTGLQEAREMLDTARSGLRELIGG